MVKKKSLEWLNCSEEELKSKLRLWLKCTNLGNAILFLEGEMGAGKSTFVRGLLQVLAPEEKSAGSPTFPLVQEYRSMSGSKIYHIDLYRIKREQELVDSGIETQIEEQGALSCVEWASLFQSYFSFWMNSARKRPKSVYQINISNAGEFRNYRIEEI
jgi:tRNA threonylcarbamoyladenosine biosynthesis protein TsaE